MASAQRHDADPGREYVRGAGRVLFASTVSYLGGAERSLFELACALAPLGWRPALGAWQPGPLVEAFESRGFEVHVYRELGRQPGSPLGGATLRYPWIRPAVRLALWSAIALRPIRREVAWLESLIETGRFSLVHSNCDLSIPAAHDAARRAGICYVAHVRDHWRHWFHPRILSRLRRADAVLVSSDAMARRLRAVGSDPYVAYNPVAGDRLCRPVDAGERAAWRREFDIDDAFAVAIIGRLDPQKRVDTAIRATALLRRRGVPVVLLIAGSGPEAYARRLRDLAAYQGAEPAVRWLGHRTNVAEWLPALDALVMPSRGEPFGRAIVEGMLAGLPVVAAADGAGPELIEDGRTGLLVPSPDAAGLADALGRLAANRDYRHALGRNARITALDRFDPATSAATVAALYDRLMPPARSGP